MDSQKRLLLAVGLALLLTLGYSFLSEKLNPRPPDEIAAAGAKPPGQAAVDGGSASPLVAGDVVAGGSDGGSTLAAAPPAAELPPLRMVEVAREGARYKFTTAGAGLVSAPLLGDKMREQPTVGFFEGLKRLTGTPFAPPPHMDMAAAPSARDVPLSVEILGPRPLPSDARYAVTEEPQKLTFTTTQGGWEITKVFGWTPAGYELSYDLTVKNVSEAPAEGSLAIHYGRAIDATKEEKPSLMGQVGNQSRAACMVAENFTHLLPGADPLPDANGPVQFFGVDQQYFLAAVFPREAPLTGTCRMAATDTARTAQGLFPISLAPGQSTTLKLGVYIGPKDLEMLRNVPAALTAGESASAAAYRPLLDKTVDFGIWAVICNVLLAILKFFHGITGNWGLAIILLTLLVRLAMVPLAHKSMMSAEAMKKLAPKLKEIREKFANDREKQNMETMKLYQEAKVNPVGGCLPLIVQMPIWIALFTTLRNSYELYREPFFGPIWFDLTFKDPIYFLPLALGVTQVVTMKLQPQMMDEAQAKMMTYVMPVMFTFFMLNYPAGLTLYIFTSNLFQIAQQYVLRKWIERRSSVAAEPATVGRKK